MEFLTLFYCLSLFALAVGEKISVCKTTEINVYESINKTSTGKTTIPLESEGKCL